MSCVLSVLGRDQFGAKFPQRVIRPDVEYALITIRSFRSVFKGGATRCEINRVVRGVFEAHADFQIAVSSWAKKGHKVFHCAQVFTGLFSRPFVSESEGCAREAEDQNPSHTQILLTVSCTVHGHSCKPVGICGRWFTPTEDALWGAAWSHLSPPTSLNLAR